jgi:hypothetical protein
MRSYGKTCKKFSMKGTKISIAVQVNSSVPQNPGKPLGRVLIEAFEEIQKQGAENL